MKTYSILSYNRTGSTVVGQCLAAHFGSEYQAEISNIPSVLMRYDENGNDINVPFKQPLPKGTYVKTYTIENGYVKRLLKYNNPEPFILGTNRHKLEVDKRIGFLNYNLNSEYKSIFKIQPQSFMQNFGNLEVLNGYSFIFCARKDIREQILSYLIAMETKLFHIGYDEQVVDMQAITIKRKHFDFCLEGLRLTNKMFEYFKEQKQIEKIIYYEDWQEDTSKILPLLGFKHTPANTFKKIKYTVGEKHNLVNNLEQVYDWMNNAEEFNYTYKL